MAKSNYFRFPNFLAIATVLPAMALLTLAYIRPDLMPYPYLGPVGQLIKYFITQQPTLLKYIFYAAYGLHAIEASFAMKMCSDKQLTAGATLKWLASVLVFGYFSMYYLSRHQPSQTPASEAKRGKKKPS